MTIASQRSLSEYRRLSKVGWRRVCLLCGAAATALYIGMDAIVALRYEGYSYIDQTISELSAIGAPTRPLWIPLGFVYSVLTIAGGVGIWAAAEGERRLRIVGAVVAAIGVVGLVAWPLAPMHQREALAAGGGTTADTMHLVLAMVDTVLFMAAIAVGAAAFGRRFRRYSWTTIAVVLVAGALTGMQGGKVADDVATPWLGVTERIAVFGSMVWIAVLALGLFRIEGQRENAGPGSAIETRAGR